MVAKRIGFALGALALLASWLLPAPEGLPREGFIVAGLTVLMAAWWMTEALPLTATAFMPFLVLPFAGVMSASDAAGEYYSDILFLLLGGAFIALAVERTGLHRRLATGILRLAGHDAGPGRLLLAFMVATGLLSTFISNTSTALIMMPMALAVLEGGGVKPEDRGGISGALPIGIAFAATIGGFGTIVGTPTNAISVGLLEKSLGYRIGFAEWMAYGMPLAIVGIPLAALVIARVQRLGETPFDAPRARAAIASHPAWTLPEKRLVPVVAATFLLWLAQAWAAPLLPAGSLTDGSIAIAASLVLFLAPDGTGRPLLTWAEADRAPWGVIMMFGGGLALAAGMSASGLAEWIGRELLPLRAAPLIVVALVVTGLVILITEFASNVATASAVMPVIAGLTVALGADPLLLALPAAFAASWGFMLPAGTGPNAIAWATGRIRMGAMVRAGLCLDVVGVVLIVGVVWAVRAFL
ncbi:MAG: DASS family sodium-coupled anion symporter [Qipengyuania sp.]|jgi:solute carrier family 13 (sodium-dependent dicarboxylate transporter), member 2/3/5|nr:DASS family sodium-coupled anion symporter [Qipengyuania sp.]